VFCLSSGPSQEAVLRVHDDVLVLQLMVWPDEVRPVAGIAPEAATVRPQELAMAKSLIETLSADFPDLADDLHDDYQAALQNLVEAKLEGAAPPHEAPSRAAKDNVIDLMAVLERSVEAAQGGRARKRGSAETAPPAKKAAAKTPGRKAAADEPAAPEAEAEAAPASRAPAKKAAKKAPAKKTAAAKTRRRAS